MNISRFDPGNLFVFSGQPSGGKDRANPAQMAAHQRVAGIRLAISEKSE
ncbi:hypothetical protein H3V53_36475 [Paraburkholderia bengalensis]|uniref:Uncharacterized protein n=1 Tax=Paraburkholderia bengalensis TaxID=2747562 RepID=A0ABU8J3T9_9BURK